MSTCLKLNIKKYLKTSNNNKSKRSQTVGPPQADTRGGKGRKAEEGVEWRGWGGGHTPYSLSFAYEAACDIIMTFEHHHHHHHHHHRSYKALFSNQS